MLCLLANGLVSRELVGRILQKQGFYDLDLDRITRSVCRVHFSRIYYGTRENLEATLRRLDRKGRISGVAAACVKAISEQELGGGIVVHGRIALRNKTILRIVVLALRRAGYRIMKLNQRADNPNAILLDGREASLTTLLRILDARRKFLIGSFGRENDSCAIAALSILDKVPEADILIHMDCPGLDRWGGVFGDHGIETIEWTPYEPHFTKEMVDAVGRSAIPKKANPKNMHAVCVRFFRYRMLLHYLRGGNRVDADTIALSDPEELVPFNNEFVISAYTKTQACCGVISCTARHPLVRHWYMGMSGRRDVCEEWYFNMRMRRNWDIRYVHHTQPFIYDMVVPGQRRKKRMWSAAAAWDPESKWASIAHYHSAGDKRVRGSRQYRYMSASDIMDFPINGEGSGNRIVTRMREVVEKYDLVERAGEA